MKWLLLVLLLSVASLLPAGLVITLDNGTRLDLYSDYYALVIGNSDYQHFPKLRGVKQDVKDVKATLEKLGVKVNLLENLSGAQLQKAFNDFVDIQGKVPNRALILYYAGHGYTEERADGTDLGYIVPIDTPFFESNRSEFRNKAISMTRINEYAELIRSKHVLMVFDSCFSGTLFTARRAAPQIIDEKTSQPVRQFITAGAANEAVPDQSVFKITFVKGLGDGYADLNRDGYVTGEELGSYLENEVVNYSKGNQHPKYGKIANPRLDLGDIVFALKTTAVEKTTTTTPATSDYKPPVTTHDSELERMTGDLRITTDFETEVFVDRVSRGKVQPGYALNVRALIVGIHLVELFYGNAKLGETILIRENDTARLDWKLSAIQSRINSTNRFTLNSDPQGASFSLESYPGFSGNTPFVFVDPVSTPYKVTLVRPRFRDTVAEFSTSSSAKQETVKLGPLFGNLKLSSEPSGCLVWLNDKQVGSTPLDLSGEQKGLDLGTYTLRVKEDHPDAVPVVKQITIKANETLKEHVIVKEVLAYLTVKSDFFPLKISAGGRQLAVMDQESKLKLKPGTYQLEIEPISDSHIGMKTVSTSLTLGVDEDKQLQVRLIPEPTEFLVESNKPEARFTLANDKGIKHELKGSTAEIYAGTYTFTASNWGYYTQQYRLELKGKQRNIARVEFEPIPSPLLKQQGKWKLHRYGAIATLAAGIGTAAYMYHQAELDYADYQSASTPLAAQDCRVSYLNSRRNYYTALGLNVLPTLWYAYSWFKGVKASHRVRAEMNSRIGN